MKIDDGKTYSSAQPKCSEQETMRPEVRFLNVSWNQTEFIYPFLENILRNRQIHIKKQNSKDWSIIIFN